jgi:hypothetical protein
MRKKFLVFNDFGNHAEPIIIGQVRRLADEFGRLGIEAKAGAANVRIRRPRVRSRAIFSRAFAEVWGDRVSTRRFKINKRP